MTLRYTTTIGRRLITILFITQSLASAGLIATFTINPIVGARLSGQDALAGLPGTLLQIGAALAAFPLGRLMQSAGRRVGLTLGFVLGTVGMLIGGIAIASGSFVLFLVGLVLVAAGWLGLYIELSAVLRYCRGHRLELFAEVLPNSDELRAVRYADSLVGDADARRTILGDIQ